MTGIRGRILPVTFLLCGILPLFASTFVPFPGLRYREDGFPIRNGREDVRNDINKLFGAFGFNVDTNDNNNGFRKPNKRDRKNQEGKFPQLFPVPPLEEANKVVDKPAPTEKGLQLGFYQQTCPQAEQIVQNTLNKILDKNVKIAPALIRLFFHDCFVTGCDASILLDKTPSGDKVEKQAPHNGLFVKGFNEIEQVKTALEAECPGIVSCSDILAFVTREALNQTGVPRYDVPAGRRDRPVSLAKNCDGNLPFPDEPADESIKMFTKKGLTLEDLVLLLGAHSIGEAHCTVVSNRFRDPEKRKDISPRYLDQLNVQLFCQDPDQSLPFDRMSSNMMDVGYYKQIMARETLLESDHNLARNANANKIMDGFVRDKEGWMEKFIKSINKLGEVEVLTGDEGEIRRQCNAVN